MTVVLLLQSVTKTNGLKIQWIKYVDGFVNGVVKSNITFPLPYSSPDSCIIMGYYDNSSGTMSRADVGARLQGMNTNLFKAITGGGMYSFFAIGY